MNMSLRNFPKPPLSVVYSDCGLSERTALVIAICNRTNEIMEYVFGLESTQVLVPAQSNVDARMPLRFLRPCVQIINNIITTQGLTIDSVPMPGDSLDYHGFVPLTRNISETLNAIIEEL
jgi:hypothetical protein